MTFTVFFALLAMLLAFSVSAADEKIMRRHRTIDAAGEVEETIMKAAKADEQSYGAMRMIEVEDHGAEGKEFMLQVEVVDHDCQGHEGTDPVKHHYKVHPTNSYQGRHYASQLDQGHEGTDPVKHQGTQHHYAVHPTNSDQEKHKNQPQAPTNYVKDQKKAAKPNVQTPIKATKKETKLVKETQAQKEIRKWESWGTGAPAAAAAKKEPAAKKKLLEEPHQVEQQAASKKSVESAKTSNTKDAARKKAMSAESDP